MMKNSKISALRGALVGALMLTASSALAAEATASATILKALTIVNDTGLSFGDILATTAGGTVTVTPAGARSATGVGLGTSNEGVAASFTVTGDPDRTYTLTLPAAGTVTLDNLDTVVGGSMTIASFSSDVATTEGAGLLDGTGEQTVNVGAALTVGANQNEGSYEGTFDVTVAYN